MSTLLLAAAATALALPTMFRMQRHLAQLTDAARRVSAGDLAQRVHSAGKAELDDLADAINAVAERLQDSNTTLEAFAYTVSHDLRAPIRAMHGFSNALLEDYGPQLGNQGKDYATRVVSAATRMDGLLQDLLIYSRLSRADIASERVDLEALTDAILLRMREQIAERRAAIEVLRPLPVVTGHRAMLQQCLEHLIGNALKFTAPDAAPRLRIGGGASSSAGAARLWIEDEGIGIPAEDRERVFRIFERLHGVESYAGNGIGLALVKKGIERMRGRVGVDVAPGGQGSRFWLELPAS